MIKVAINGYGTIGKRVADAVTARPDKIVLGVSKAKPSPEAFVAKSRGYPLYIADISKKAAFEKASLPVAGSVEEMLKVADIVVDATLGGVGAKNKPEYESLGIKAIWQGGEEHEFMGFKMKEDDFEINRYRSIPRSYKREVPNPTPPRGREPPESPPNSLNKMDVVQALFLTICILYAAAALFLVIENRNPLLSATVVGSATSVIIGFWKWILTK
jgi:hypothetical protein